MQIQKFDPASQTPPELPHSKFGAVAATNGKAAASAARSQSPDAVDPGGELSQLIQQLREHPEVRQDLVDLVRANVARGDYETRAAAEKAAALLLGTDG